MEFIIPFSIVVNIILGAYLYNAAKEKRTLYNRYEQLLRFCYECKKNTKAPEYRGFTQFNELDKFEKDDFIDWLLKNGLIEAFGLWHYFDK